MDKTLPQKYLLYFAKTLADERSFIALEGQGPIAIAEELQPQQYILELQHYEYSPYLT